ncbi:hypothetical protein [Streptomyces sp. S.PB5]|uniref:hypothetical protein n=1 Tax=Streptomyces sp. S.PB5 TaxID=3020844 RepID=UPI0025AFFDE6|nr:hypothetical protein [Streptomyces sp. S.PB5]MDN3023140.1 hypothetical protein [Streptomyces sp. S.PB5]
MAVQDGPQAAPRQGPGCLRGCVSLVVLIGIVYAIWWFTGGKDSDDTSSVRPSSAASASASDPADGGGSSGAWKIGDCGGPDPDRAPDGYKAFDCGDSAATFKALKIMDGSILPAAIQCPAGTDLIIEVSMSFGSDPDDSGGGGGIPTDTVCGRNLTGDHPGDAGAGGGQLVKGDCIDQEAQEIACAQSGAGDLKVLGLVEGGSARCPSGTTDPVRLTVVVGRPYDTICAKAF